MSSPSRSGECPFRLNLEQQKKRAKELFKACQNGDKDARVRFITHHPKFSHSATINPADIKLADAQFVIARELGLASWAKLKLHIQSMNCASDAIDAGHSAPDGDMTTLHIRCGTDLQTTLPAAGFSGDVLEYSDPVCQGPVSQSPDQLIQRAEFLYKAYGASVERSQQTIQHELETAQQQLIQAAQKYRRVVLWFEHDSYDQLILARLLAYFDSHQKPECLELVSLNHFPGSVRFIGLGQLPPEAIRMLWAERKPVTTHQLSLGREIWNGLCDNTPAALNRIMRSSEITQLENMAPAILRHLQELPSVTNGLGLTEQLTLDMCNERSLTAGQAFGLLMREKDPLPWLGDVMYQHILLDMARAKKPSIKFIRKQADEPWFKNHISVTETGMKLLAGEVDWLICEPPSRWLGGYLIDASTPTWRWDRHAQHLVSP